MGKIFSGIGLLTLSLFMLLGYLRVDLPSSPAVSVLTFIIAVALPAVGGALLLHSWFARRSFLRRRKELLRRQTLQAEILKLAERKDGNLTVVEVVGELGITRDEASIALDAFAVQGAAEVEISESGLLIYTFKELQMLSEKHSIENIRRN